MQRRALPFSLIVRPFQYALECKARPREQEMKMKNPLMMLALGCAALLLIAPARAQIVPRDVDLTAPDGAKLKGTFFSARKPGPAVMLFHQCNRERSTWGPLAAQLAQAGINVLTMDNRGFGGSGGDRYASLTMQQRGDEAKLWPADFDIAFEYL